jgi:[FeFe] hydrogenase (group B1/B3)
MDKLVHIPFEYYGHGWCLQEIFRFLSCFEVGGFLRFSCHMVPLHAIQKRDVLIRLIRAFNGQNFHENIDVVLTELGKDCDCCPNHLDPPRRQAFLRSMLMTTLGLPCDGGEDMTPARMAEMALELETPCRNVLSVIKCACHACASHVRVTNICQNCPAKPCIDSCKFGAIRSSDAGSVIDDGICKKCNLCVRACPYGAIVKTVIPCENVCPVKAIGKDADGVAEIDFEKCIGCGRCLGACPFGAIHTKSQVISVLRAMKAGKEVIALIAPSIFGQFSCSPEQLHSAIGKVGFSFVYEVSVGAETTSIVEAAELKERLERGDKFMTSSCCAAYGALVDKHIRELKPFLSTAGTPVFYTAELAKKEHPDAILVFVSPCLAKYEEVFSSDRIGYAINFGELDAMFDAFDIHPETCEEKKFDYPSAREAKEFPISGGVGTAVLSAYAGDRSGVKVGTINGIDRESVETLKRFGKSGECDSGNMLEVMSCPGGCLGGTMTICPLKVSKDQVKKYASKSGSIDPHEKNIP